MLLRRVRVPLPFQAPQRGNQLGTCRAGQDHLIDEPSGGGDERVSKLVAKLGDLLGAQRVRVGGSGELEGLGWYPFREALAMPLSDITEFVLRQAIGLIERPDCRRPTRGVPLCRYRNEVFYSAGV